MTVIEKAPESPQGYLDELVRRSKAGLFPSVEKNEYGGTGCRYRTEDGRACVIGVAFPDSAYDPKMEGRSVYGLLDDNLLPIPAFARTGNKEADIRRLGAVQAVHDDMAYEPWNHDEFVRRLLGLELFERLTPALHK